MRFLYHIKHGAQLFEEDGVDHSKGGWFEHPEKAGLVGIIDPNGPTKWVSPDQAPKVAKPVEAPAGPKVEALWIQIPKDWTDLHWKQQCALAAQIAGVAVETKPAAVAIIEAELERRKA